MSGTRTGRHSGNADDSPRPTTSAPLSSTSPYQSPYGAADYPGQSGYDQAGYEYDYSYDAGYPQQQAEYSGHGAHSYPYEQPGGEERYQRGRTATATLPEPELIPDPHPAAGYFSAPPADPLDDLADPQSDPSAIPDQRARAEAGDGGPRRPGRQRGGQTGPVGKAVRGLVVLGLVGAASAFVAFDKTIEISVDGQTRQVHTFASTVGSVLSDNGITTGAHDQVSPAPGASATDNSTITIRYGRPVQVTVNGVESQDWVHYPTVGGALSELGVRVTGAVLSVPSGTAIGRQGLAFTVFTQRQVTILVDGKTMHLATTAPTVSALLVQAGITLQNQDSASVAGASVPTDGETISIMRITGTTETKQVSIPYQVTKQSNPNAYSGVTSVLTPGVTGIEQITYALQIINGVSQSPKQISETVTRQPVNEVLSVGTKSLPTNVADLDWSALAKCESGGRVNAVDSSGTYYGLYQFSVQTWDSLGGSGLPSQASAAEQTSLAELLYSRSGVGQWPVCGPNLYK
ncbi:MAG TPA: ubiquitin-like domain-containing protein [Actinocrinis sp.]|nr:ubiquitin-like domain-containing protein [Actinocrinis sp.]